MPSSVISMEPWVAKRRPQIKYIEDYPQEEQSRSWAPRAATPNSLKCNTLSLPKKDSALPKFKTNSFRSISCGKKLILAPFSSSNSSSLLKSYKSNVPLYASTPDLLRFSSYKETFGASTISVSNRVRQIEELSRKPTQHEEEEEIAKKKSRAFSLDNPVEILKNGISNPLYDSISNVELSRSSDFWLL